VPCIFPQELAYKSFMYVTCPAHTNFSEEYNQQYSSLCNFLH
jgi:hypothetical protein